MQATLQSLAAELDATLSEAETSRDPLAAHIYRSRIAYERACQHDQTKSQKRVEWEINRSYGEALALGYRGQRGEWLVILFSRPQSGTSAAAGSAREKMTAETGLRRGDAAGILGRRDEMNTQTLPPEDLVKKVRAGLQSDGFIILPLDELDPVFGDEDHRFERVLQLHEFATACEADCLMESDEQRVRFCRKCSGGVSVAA